MTRSYFSEKNILDMDPTANASDIKEGMKVTGNGKGDNTRPSQISKEEYARNYCRTFGHKLLSDTQHCGECGLSAAAISHLRETIKK